MAERKYQLMKGGTFREPLSPISLNQASTRTPGKKRNTSCITKTPSGKTPSKTPNKKSVTSSVSEGTGYDRFIPNRALMNKELGHHMLMKKQEDAEEDDEKEEYSEAMRQNLNNEVEKQGARILQMKIKAPQTKEGEVATKMLYTKSKPTPAKFKSTRHIPSVADKILDAPDIVDDYYLNLLDWGRNGLIAVPLYNAVYLWNSESGSVEELFGDTPITDDNIMVTSVKWITEGMHIAIGLSDGNVELWDAAVNKRVRSMAGHPTRVGSLDWNQHILTSGARSGSIFNHDVRVANHHISSFNNHTQEICGLQWSPDGKLLASGANDNTLNVWDMASTSATTAQQTSSGVNEVTTPLHSLCEHMAAVKAVSWCPWQRNVLASGGGTVDRHIRIWNATTGSCLNSLDTMGQISGILWSNTYKELICSHGNQMTIWKYPSMTRETELNGHVGRILNITSSPNGVYVATAGSDETLRLWKCFEPDVKKSSSRQSSKKEESSRPRMNALR